jgi:hypothetical protein
MSEVNQNGGAPQYRDLPENSLDFNMRVIDPAWSTATPSLVTKSKTGGYRYMEKDGEIYICVKDIVTNLDFFTRDIRLSNFDEKDIKALRWYLEFAGSLANQKYFEAFNFCLTNVANICESSQGRGGFLRKIFNTLRMENVQGAIAQGPQRSFMTGKTKEGGG